jgi:pilus assembly protein CpaC
VTSPTLLLCLILAAAPAEARGPASTGPLAQARPQTAQPATPPSGQPATPQGAPAATGAASAPETLRIDREVSAVKELALDAGENRLLVFSDEIARVAVADPEVADLKVVTPTQLLLTAKEVGKTDLTLWNRAGEPLVIALKVANNAEALRKQLKELFPDQDVRVSAAGDLMVLSGEVSDVRLPERIAEVARLHSRQIANLVQVTGNQQVQLVVRFAEVSRSGLREMGVNLFHKATDVQRVAGMSSPGISPGNFLNTPSNPSIPTAGAPDLYAPVYNNAFSLFFAQAFDAFPFSVMLSLLEANGLAKVLAEPSLVTLTGQEAKFLAGGEIPIPLTSGLGQTNVVWKKFGIQLAFTPTVIAENTIHLQLATEVSEIDPTIAVVLSGSSIPGIVSRQGQTTVRLGDGQSFAIAGLLSEKGRSQVDKVPLLGSIPILGALFRSSAYRREETELLIVVTARLARPLPPDQMPAMPTERLTPPGDLQLFLLGALEGKTPPVEEERRQRTDGTSKKEETDRQPAGPVGFLR